MAQPSVVEREGALVTVPLSKLAESGRNPRKSFDEGAHRDLVASITRHGVLAPLLVRELPGAGTYEILAGARRYRAAKEVGLADLPCRVVAADDDTALEIMVVENLQRQDVHPLEEAEGFRHLLEISGGDYVGVAAKTAKTRAYIAQRLALLSLVKEARKIFLAGKMGVEHAVLIARLQPADQKETVEASFRHEEIPTVGSLRKTIEERVLLDLSKAPWKLDDETLVTSAGSCQACPKRTGQSRDLFSDMKKGDRCADPSCFKVKMRAHLDAVQKVLEGQGHTVYGLWDSWHHEKAPEGVLKQDEFTEIKKRDFCDKAAKGVFLEGSRSGQAVDVCPSGDGCKIHGPGRFHGKTPAEKEKTRKENLKLKRESEVRLRTLRQMTVNVSLMTLPLDVHKRVAHAMFDRLWHEAKRRVVRVFQLPEKKEKYGGFSFKPVEKHLESLGTHETVNAFMVVCSQVGDLDPRFDGGKLNETANLLGVDVSPIARDVDEEFEAKAKKKPKALPKSKGKGGKKAGKPASPKAPKREAPPPAEEPEENAIPDDAAEE